MGRNGFKRLAFRIYAEERFGYSQQASMRHPLNIHEKTWVRPDEISLAKSTGAWNRGWDAQWYALDGYIQKRGVGGVWAQLAS
jgi:hypothetical protein